PPPEAPSPDQSPTGAGKTHTGFVARLPKNLRDQVNLLLLDNTPYKKIIQSLGEPGSHLNEGHIGQWKAGGYQDWLEDLRRAEALGIARDSAIDLLSKNAGATVQDASRAVAAAQLYELLL